MILGKLQRTGIMVSKGKYPQMAFIQIGNRLLLEGKGPLFRLVKFSELLYGNDI